MDYSIGAGEFTGDRRTPLGPFQEVAVKCWFTAGGRAMPLMMKVRAKGERIIKVNDIHVMTEERRWIGGILNIKYQCRTHINDKEQDFILMFNPKECAWRMGGWYPLDED